MSGAGPRPRSSDKLIWGLMGLGLKKDITHQEAKSLRMFSSSQVCPPSSYPLPTPSTPLNTEELRMGHRALNSRPWNFSMSPPAFF